MSTRSVKAISSPDEQLTGSIPHRTHDRSKRLSLFYPDYTIVKPAKNCVITVFVVALLAISIAALMVGVLALMASQGALPVGLNSLTNLAVIGHVNSYFMIFGAAFLFILSTCALVSHLKRQSDSQAQATCPLDRLLGSQTVPVQR